MGFFNYRLFVIGWYSVIYRVGTKLTLYMTNIEVMKKSELTFFKILIGVIYALLAVLVIIAIAL